MAYSRWVKMRTDLARDWRVRAMAHHFGLHYYHVVGALHAVWSIADELMEPEGGVLRGWRHDDIDDLVRLDGFARQMESIGWLGFDEAAASVIIPEPDKHLDATAKANAVNNKRQDRKRKRDAGRDSERDNHRDSDRDTRRDTHRDGQRDSERDLRGKKEEEELTPSSPHAGARETAASGGGAPTVPDRPPPEVIAALAEWKGSDLSSSDDYAACAWWRDNSTEGEIDVGQDRRMRFGPLLELAIDDAIDNGANFKNTTAGLRYVGAIVARCIAEKRLPGEKPNGHHRSNGRHRDAAAERRAAERAGQHPEDLADLPIIKV